jgi:hypothetical protein
MTSGTPAYRTMICYGGKHYKGSDKNTIAKVTDGNTTRFMEFGPHWKINYVNEIIPRLWMDFRTKRGRKNAS